MSATTRVAAITAAPNVIIHAGNSGTVAVGVRLGIILCSGAGEFEANMLAVGLGVGSIVGVAVGDAAVGVGVGGEGLGAGELEGS